MEEEAASREAKTHLLDEELSDLKRRRFEQAEKAENDEGFQLIDY